MIGSDIDRPPSSIAPDDKATRARCEAPAIATGDDLPGRNAKSEPRRRGEPAYKRRRSCYDGSRRIFSTERKGDRHGQGSDAQQQEKEEAEGGQEPQEGRHDSGQSVRDREDAGRPKPQQQEELTARVFLAAHANRPSRHLLA